MTRAKSQLSAAFVAGLLFAIGIALAGMAQPSKVLGFFDFTQGLTSWDPSLAFVMLGGILVYVPVFRLIRGRDKPVFAATFRLPTRTDIDRPLVLGAALFGAGWGLSGYCPGPGITSLGSGSQSALIVVASMIVGMKAHQWAGARGGLGAEKSDEPLRVELES